MTIGAIVQARMSSERLPGKVLMSLAGKSVLQYVLESLGQSEMVGQVIVAASNKASDDRVARFCDEYGVVCWRGALDDVTARLLGAAKKFDLDHFIRVSADSPLLDWRIVDRAVKLYGARGCDLVTNVFPRSWPKGQSVEVLRTETLRRVQGKMRDGEDREHVTRFFYDYPEQFQIKNFSSRQNWGGLSLCVDTVEDLRRVERLVQRMDRPHWEYTAGDLVSWQS